MHSFEDQNPQYPHPGSPVPRENGCIDSSDCRRSGQALLSVPANLAGSIGGGVSGIRFNQVNDSLCLGQIHFPV